MSVQLKGGKDPNSPWREYTVVGIIGSRRRNTKEDEAAVRKMFESVAADFDLLSVPTAICSGGCPQGGDRFAQLIAQDYGLPMLIHYPNWKKYGKSAGFVRNNDIAHDSDILIACVAPDRKGGTEDTISKFIHKEQICLVL